MFKNLLKTFKEGGQPAAPAPAPAAVEHLISAGNTAEDAGRFDEALACYRRAVALAPALPKAHLNLGIVQEALGDAIAARASYEKVLALDPGHPFGAYNLAKLHYIQGALAPAEDLLRQGLARKPDFAEAWVLLSNVLDARGKAQEAADAIERGLALKPDYAGALYNHATILRRLERLDEAEAAAARAVALEPDPQYLGLHSALLAAQGFPERALEPLRRAIALQPHRFDLRSNELFLLNLVDGVGVQELWERHRALGAEVEAAVPAMRLPRVDHDKARLRVGFVSGDLRAHPVTLFLVPVLERLTRERFEVFCYSSTANQDEFTGRVRALSDHWIDAREWTDARLTEAIAADAIDILIDLGGHSGDVRLGVFVGKPAPVQITWLGYLNTTGLTRIDYRLSDARCDPPAVSQPRHSEQLVLLPHSQWCFRPFVAVEPAPGAPCERNGHVTFGSFNKVAKLTRGVALRWGRVLQALPTARLLVADVGSAKRRAALLSAIVEGGGAADRVEFAPRLDLHAYYRLMDRIDIALDSYPYGGGTTTFDALWMGVPVLTATGELPASRSAASILAALGLDEWIARDIDQYEALAIQRAADVDEIARLRRTLRERLRSSPLMDEEAFTRAFQAALERAWKERAGGD